MELVFIFAIVMLLLLGVMLFIALGMYRSGYRTYPPPMNDLDGRVYAPPPLPTERPGDRNWHGV